MNTEQRLLLELLSSGVCQRPIKRGLFEGINSDLIASLYDLSQKHRLAHIAGLVLEENHLFPEDCEEYKEKFFEAQLAALNHYEQLKYSIDEIGKAFERAKIKFIPLKGSVICKYYPEPWMRYSCDTDILVNDNDLDHAVECLTKELGYSYIGKGSHDVSLNSPGGLHLELHYSLNEPAFGVFELLEKVWDYAGPDADNKFLYRLSDKVFYYYHIVHMAKHFVYGGCGVRPFLDLWLMRRKMDNLDETRLAVSQSSLCAFEEACVKLSETWFGEESETGITEAMERYIFAGGAYGTLVNTISVKRTKKTGVFRYVFSRIFISYDKLKYLYPVLFKHKWLTPFCEVRRWFRLVFTGGIGKSVNEFKINSRLSSETIDNVGKLLDTLELNKI